MTRVLQFVGGHWLAITGIVFAAVTILSLLPLDEPPPVPGSDKLHHLIAYGCLMFPAAYVRPPKWVWYAAFFVVWGGLIEIIQPYVNRYGEMADFAVNVAGVIVGLVVAAAARRWFAQP